MVVAAGPLEAAHGLLWVLMITSADNRGWRTDVAVSDLAMAGLPVPSVVRSAKIATIEARDAQRIGRLPRSDCVKVAAQLGDMLTPVGLARIASRRRPARR